MVTGYLYAAKHIILYRFDSARRDLPVPRL